jgi:hypothetical protein
VHIGSLSDRVGCGTWFGGSSSGGTEAFFDVAKLSSRSSSNRTGGGRDACAVVSLIQLSESLRR